MASDILIKFNVYDLQTYFSKQPESLIGCPDCGGALAVSNVNPSKAVLAALAWESLIPTHDFSRLYQCKTCFWWGIWESWAYRECNSSGDCFIMRATDGTRKITVTAEQYASPWKQILEDENVYKNAMPVPPSLGQLFMFGERKHFFWMPTNS